MPPRLNPLYLQTLLAVARSGSPSAAAAAIGMNVTTVYRHIDGLEQALGVQVFERRHRGWIVRSEAAFLIDCGDDIERLLHRAQTQARAASGAGSPLLRIAVSDDFALHYVAPRLTALRAANRLLQPDLVVSHRFADLDLGEADVAIRPHMAPGDTLIGRKVGRMLHAIYASQDYVRRCGGPASVDELRAHAVCGFGSALADYTVAQWFAARVDPDAVVARFGSTSAMTGAVEAGLGLGLLPCFVGDAMSALVPVLAVEDGLPIDIWLVATAANRRRPNVLAFFKYFAEAIKRDAMLFRGVPYAR